MNTCTITPCPHCIAWLTTPALLAKHIQLVHADEDINERITTMTKQEARKHLDEAWCLYFEALGYDRAEADYSAINELIDDITNNLTDEV